MHTKITKAAWIIRYGGQSLLDAEGFEVVPCENCTDTICHGWKVQRKQAPRELVATSHGYRFSYWKDFTDRYIYQFDEIGKVWVGWLCALSTWEDGFFRTASWMDTVPEDFYSAAPEVK